LKQILTKLFDHQPLTHAEAHAAMRQLGEGGANPAETAAFLAVYRMRPITVAELAGFRQALLDLSRDPALGTTAVLDIVGTGGDGKNTLNISTLACFVVAGAGVRVAKHGNFGVSSVSGASNVLAHFGYDFEASSDQLRRQLDRAGICFLHAPAFHPAMRHAGPVRRELGLRTFFNILGPLVNPARPGFQLLGVFNLELQRIYHYLMQPTGTRYAVVHALDGYDELALTGPAKVVSSFEGERLLTAETLGRAVQAGTRRGRHPRPAQRGDGQRRPRPAMRPPRPGLGGGSDSESRIVGLGRGQKGLRSYASTNLNEEQRMRKAKLFSCSAGPLSIQFAFPYFLCPPFFKPSSRTSGKKWPPAAS
jgi:anthranilate phosphoribosyltransferase